MAGQLDSLFKSVAKQIVADLGSSFDSTITYVKKGISSYNIDTGAITGTTGKDGNFSEVKLGDLQVKYNTESQGTGSINNILDVYPWLQSYLGAYMLGGAGSFQMRVVRG